MACGAHVLEPGWIAVSGRIEGSASRYFCGGKSLDDHHRGAAEGAMPVRGAIRRAWPEAGLWRRIITQQLLAERQAFGAEAIGQKSEVPDSDEAFGQHM